MAGSGEGCGGGVEEGWIRWGGEQGGWSACVWRAHDCSAPPSPHHPHHPLDGGEGGRGELNITALRGGGSLGD